MVFTHSTDSLYACLGDSLTPATRPNFTNWKTKGNEQLSRTHQGFPKHQEHTVKSPFSMPNWHAVPVVPLVITYRNSWHPAKNTPPWSTCAAASPGFSPRHQKKWLKPRFQDFARSLSSTIFQWHSVSSAKHVWSPKSCPWPDQHWPSGTLAWSCFQYISGPWPSAPLHANSISGRFAIKTSIV